MSGELSLFTFEDEDGSEVAFTTTNAIEAKEVGRRNRWKVIDNTFEWADSEVAWDFTERTEDDQ